MTKTLDLDPGTSGVLVIDYQERLAAAMPAHVLERNLRHVVNVLTLARRLEMPVVATEQYPKGLGPTLAPIRELLSDAPHPKTAFSVARDEAAAAALGAHSRGTWLVCGMETHICVFQTVRDLVGAGTGVQVLSDGVVSRAETNWRVGLDLCREAGAVITCAETALFDLLKVGRGEAFKEVSRLVR